MIADNEKRFTIQYIKSSVWKNTSVRYVAMFMIRLKVILTGMFYQDLPLKRFLMNGYVRSAALQRKILS